MSTEPFPSATALGPESDEPAHNQMHHKQDDGVDETKATLHHSRNEETLKLIEAAKQHKKRMGQLTGLVGIGAITAMTYLSVTKKIATTTLGGYITGGILLAYLIFQILSTRSTIRQNKEKLDQLGMPAVSSKYTDWSWPQVAKAWNDFVKKRKDEGIDVIMDYRGVYNVRANDPETNEELNNFLTYLTAQDSLSTRVVEDFCEAWKLDATKENPDLQTAEKIYDLVKNHNPDLPFVEGREVGQLLDLHPKFNTSALQRAMTKFRGDRTSELSSFAEQIPGLQNLLEVQRFLESLKLGFAVNGGKHLSYVRSGVSKPLKDGMQPDIEDICENEIYPRFKAFIFSRLSKEPKFCAGRKTVLGFFSPSPPNKTPTKVAIAGLVVLAAAVVLKEKIFTVSKINSLLAINIGVAAIIILVGAAGILKNNHAKIRAETVSLRY